MLEELIHLLIALLRLLKHLQPLLELLPARKADPHSLSLGSSFLNIYILVPVVSLPEHYLGLLKIIFAFIDLVGFDILVGKPAILHRAVPPDPCAFAFQVYVALYGHVVQQIRTAYLWEELRS